MLKITFQKFDFSYCLYTGHGEHDFVILSFLKIRRRVILKLGTIRYRHYRSIVLLQVYMIGGTTVKHVSFFSAYFFPPFS